MDKFHDRSLQPQDMQTVCTFAQTAEELFYIAPYAQFPWQPDAFSNNLNEYERLSNTVFLIGDDIVGFANFYNAEIGISGFIGNMVVNPHYRRQGWGKQIILHMLAKGFHEHRFNTIYISCFSPNTPALLLYKSLGFTPYGIEQRTDYKNKPIALFNFSLTAKQFNSMQANQISSSTR